MHGFGNHIFDILRGYFDLYGYWTLFFALLLENAGIPLPGETILLFASFLAFSERELQLPYIIVIGVLAATLGDNLGYTLGRRGGRALLDRYLTTLRLSKDAVVKGERIFEKYGNATIFLARFIFGMRIIAGPLAGILRMSWSRFVLFNFLGATVWVTSISFAGYFFGEHWAELIKTMGRLNLAMGAVAIYVGYVLWRRHKRSQRQKPLPTAGPLATESPEHSESSSRTV